MLQRRAAILGAVLLTAACNTDPAKGKAQATVTAASAAPLAAPAGATSYSFSNVGSELKFVGAKITAKHEGAFNVFKGTIQVADNDPTKSSVKADIDMASLSVDPEKLAGHLKTSDFFDVAQFPKATFESTAIKAGGENGATHTVSGNLTLHGVTKSITFPATIHLQGDGVDIDAEFAINRKDFNIVYPGKPDDLIKDDVLIKLKLRAKKA
jgi:polyisoprenoid-binding protein YceI